MDPKHEIMVLGQTYKIVRKIGEGAFSAVFLCRRETDDLHVAIKRAGIKDTEITKAHDEMQLMDTIGEHKNIVKVLGSEVSSVKGNPSFTFAMEFCPGTVVDEMMDIQQRGGSFDSGSSKGSSFFSSEKCMYVFSSVVNAIQHLHSLTPPITHRDIKPENILRTEDGRYVLCDFGSCTTLAYHCRDRRDAAAATSEIESNTTLLYRAPEMLEPWKKRRIDQKTDVWAMGVLLYYLMYFKFPFEETALSIINGKFSFPDTPAHPAALKEIVTLCLVPDPTGRPTVFGLAQLMRATSEFGLTEDYLPLLEELPGNEQSTPYGEHDEGPPSKSSPGVAPSQGTITSVSGTSAPPQATSGSKSGGTDLFGMLDWSESAKGSAQAPPQPVRSEVSETKPPELGKKRQSDLFAPSSAGLSSAAQQTTEGPGDPANPGNLDYLFAAPQSKSAPPNLFGSTAGSTSTANQSRGDVDLFANAWGQPQSSQTGSTSLQKPPPAAPLTHQDSDFLTFGNQQPTPGATSQSSSGTGGPASLDDILGGFSDSKMRGGN